LRQGSARIKGSAPEAATVDELLSDLGNTSGDNGLRLSSLPELKIDGESSFGCVPTLVRICASLHRGRFRFGYATYVPAEYTGNLWGGHLASDDRSVF
jgi:hypothetical protein